VNTTAEVITGVPLAADLGTTRPRPMIAVLDANPGQTGALRALILELTAHVRREPGCLAFIPYEDHGNPARFYLYEIYQDLDAFKTHLRTSHVPHFVATVSSLARNGAGDALVQLDELDIPPG
jgi:quinol monooxygenase YgiN